jgi:hypothetical protein
VRLESANTPLGSLGSIIVAIEQYRKPFL